MMIRRGSTALATVLSVAGLLVAGFGGYAAYNSLSGGCGMCCSGDEFAADTTLVADEAAPAEAGEMPSCCGGHVNKKVAGSGECTKDKGGAPCGGHEHDETPAAESTTEKPAPAQS